jgi:hypothetical protein
MKFSPLKMLPNFYDKLPADQGYTTTADTFCLTAAGNIR